MVLRGFLPERESFVIENLQGVCLLAEESFTGVIEGQQSRTTGGGAQNSAN
jgi:hypothetical protein